MPRPTLLELLTTAEAALGENLVWLGDQLDLAIRQKDAETIRRLAQLNAGWIALVRAHARVKAEGEARP
jgi:hypothetical protein